VKVADLFAKLSIKPNSASFRSAEARMGRFSKRVGQSVKNMTAQLGALASAAAIVFTAKDSLDFTENLGRLNIAAKGAFGTLDSLQSKILGISDATGVTKESIREGTAVLIALTGDAATASKVMGTLAKVSQATGASMEDVGASAAAISQSMGVASEDFEDAFSILISSGKAGSVELKEVARILAKVAAVSGQFKGGQGLDALASTSAALQLVTRAFGGKAKEGANALRQLMVTLDRAAPKLEKFGVNVFETIDGKQVRRNFKDVIDEIKRSALSNDLSALTLTLGSMESSAAFEQLTKNTGEWAALAKETRHAKDLTADYAKISKNASVKVGKAWNKTKNLITRGMSAAIDLAVKLAENIDLIGLAVFALAGAYTVLNIGTATSFAMSIRAALASAAAWIAAAAPVVLLAALVLGLALIFEDLYQAVTGGKSLLKDLFGDVVYRWAESIDRFLRETKRKFIQLKDDTIDFLTGKTANKNMQDRIQIIKDQRAASARRAQRSVGNAFRAIELVKSQPSLATSGASVSVQNTFHIVEAGNAEATAEAVQAAQSQALKDATP